MEGAGSDSDPPLTRRAALGAAHPTREIPAAGHNHRPHNDQGRPWRPSFQDSNVSHTRHVRLPISFSLTSLFQVTPFLRTTRDKQQLPPPPQPHSHTRCQCIPVEIRTTPLPSPSIRCASRTTSDCHETSSPTLAATPSDDAVRRERLDRNETRQEKQKKKSTGLPRRPR